VSASQDEASRHERAFLCFFKDDIASVLDGTSIGLLRHQLLSSLFYMGGAGWPYHSYQNVFSLIAVMGYEVNKRKRTT
jgi:hypothetical protein